MFLPHRCVRRLSAAALVAVSLLLCTSVLPAQTEEDLVKKAAVKLKLKEYKEAARVLKQAREMYPASVDVARLTAELCEKRGADPDKLIEAYRELIRVLKLKQVTEGALDPGESRLLKKTEKKLTGVAKVRAEVDAALMELIREGIRTCRLLARLEKHTGASFTYQRLSGLVEDEQQKREIWNLARELKTKRDLVKRPPDGVRKESEEARRLLHEARRSLKSGKLEKARLSCSAALKVDPGLAEARALLYQVARKARDTDQMIAHGLGYLLFPAQEQAARQAQEIEKQVTKTVPELRAFFDSTAAAAGKICKAISKALREKNRHDVEYALLHLTRLTHATREVESTISKVKTSFGGIMPWHRIFDGTKLTGWETKMFVMPEDGCIDIMGARSMTSHANYTGVSTRESFVFLFSFQVNEPLESSDGKAPPAIIVRMWGDGKPARQSDTISLLVRSDGAHKSAHIVRLSRKGKGFDTLATSSFTGPVFEPGRWYRARIDYQHKRVGDSKIVVSVNAKKVSTIPVAQEITPARTGYIGLEQQLFRSVKFKDIYLVP